MRTCESWTWAGQDAAQLLFLGCLSIGPPWHSPGHGGGRCSTAAFPKLFTFREAGTQVSPVQCHAPPQESLLHPVYHWV
jgi:hypothetical protein